MNLNPFEKELLKHLSTGISQKELAAKYNVSPTNINNFLRRARERTGMLSTVQLVVEATKNNVI